jgi:hypothetical protein
MAMAADASADSTISVGAFATHTELNDDTTPGVKPEGEGWGVRAHVGLPFSGLFIAGEAQKNELEDGAAAVDVTNSRAGVGMEFFDLGPATIDGRINYVHYAFENGTGKENQDGFGAQVGADVGIGIVGVYGAAGYMELEDLKGPELLVGVRGTLVPFLDIFGEYRYTELENDSGPGQFEFDDFRIGASFSF